MFSLDIVVYGRSWINENPWEDMGGGVDMTANDVVTGIFVLGGIIVAAWFIDSLWGKRR